MKVCVIIWVDTRSGQIVRAHTASAFPVAQANRLESQLCIASCTAGVEDDSNLQAIGSLLRTVQYSWLRPFFSHSEQLEIWGRR